MLWIIQIKIMFLHLQKNNNDRNKVKLILSEIQDHSLDVPDPYYDNGFDNVYQMLNKACTKIAKKL
jgi:protein-tyrosine phosphatase